MTIAPGLELPEETLADLCRRYQIREISLFGSTARGEARPDSDLDLLVDLQPHHTISLFDFADLQEELERLLGRRVDLVSKRGLSPHLAPHILREARLVYAA